MSADRTRWLNLFAAITLFCYYGALCGVHALERICHADTAWYLFSLIQGDNTFFLPRPSAIITLWPAMAGIVIGLPLKTLIVVYSLSFALTYAFIGIVTVWLVPRMQTVVVMTGVLFISTSHTFMNPANEATLALVLCAATLCLWHNSLKSGNSQAQIAASVSVILAALAHPSSFFMILFVLVFSHFSLTHTYRINSARLLPFLIAVLISGNTLFIQSDRSAALWLDTPTSSGLANNKALGYFLMHNGSASTMYLICTSVWLSGIIGTAIQRNWRLVALISVGYPTMVLIGSVFYSEGESAIVLEKSLLPIGLFALAAYVNFDLMMRSTMAMVGSISVLGLLVNIRANDISFRLRHHEKRFKRYTELVSHNGNRVLLASTPEVLGLFGVTWSSGAESILYLTASNPTGQSATVQVLSRDSIGRLNLDDESFIASDLGAILNSAELNPRYFHLAPGPYKVIK